MAASKNSNTGKRGFSLFELEVASFVTFIILLAAFTFYVEYLRTISAGSIILDIYSNSRIATALMTDDIKWAAQVEPSYGAYTTTDNSIVLMVPSIDASGNIIGSKFDQVIYKLQGTDLYRIAIPNLTTPMPSTRKASNLAIAHNCSNLKFSSGGVTLSNISGANLATLNTIAICSPISETIISLSGSATIVESLVPTTVVRLRNK